MRDQQNRLKAISPTQSFIVQAPAGSGKTELLTQRFLKLLSVVEKAPEEILAVTFTRKAAAQMRQRIIGALKKASMQVSATSEHEQFTLNLANDVLKRDKALNWDLQQYPNRLRILTIDAVCTYIANRMPVLSHLGGSPDIIDFPQEYYLEAVERLLKETTLEENWSSALSQLLAHLDNRIGFISELLQTMLAKRDQWLPHLGRLNQHHFSLQAYVNEGIEKFILLHLKRLDKQFDEYTKAQILELLVHAAKVCEAQDNQSILRDFAHITSFPEINANELNSWLGIAELLLTKEDTWRKSFTVKNGFLSPSEAKDKEEKQLRKARKEQVLALIDKLNENDYLRQLLAELRILPQEMNDEQSEILNAMGVLLPVLVAHLHVIFQEKGKIDFIEVNLRALNALGDELAPTDISLSLDYQIRHILIDEYQDTSSIQYRLFEKLVMGWQPDDGRTLFLVGDPMQSIYKFRGAEVSLFIQTQESGLGNIKLTPLMLECNFRSAPSIVNWINKAFVDIFPSLDEKSLGGVKFSQAFAQREQREASEIVFHRAMNESAQATLITDIIAKQLSTQPLDSIAVLVKAKRHLEALVKQLKQLRIPFIALEVEHLATRSHVMDLMSLLRALMDWSDKIAWFAILRAPWLGLSLADMLVIANASRSQLVWQTLCGFENLTGLSADGQQRLRSFVSLLQYWLGQRQRHTLSAFLRGIWISLCGPYCYTQGHILNDIDKVLGLITHISANHSLVNVDDIEKRLSQLYADVVLDENEQSATPKLELMTIHKAKGLEFDTVIIPQLQARSRNQDPSLMLWFEHAHEEGMDLILAPRRSHKDDIDPLYRFVEKQIRKKSEYEEARLLYVGATRAKKHLHFVAVLDEAEETKTSKGSFLHLLWPHIDLLETKSNCENSSFTEEPSQHAVKRLNVDTPLPLQIDSALRKNRAKTPADENLPEPSDLMARAAGTVFHRFMQRQQLEEMPSTVVIERALKRFGLFDALLLKATSLVQQGLENSLVCEKGKWIASPLHQERHHEWQLSLKTSQGIENIIIDCAFVDKDNIRWIVDYKLTHQATLNEEELALEVEKYRAQLTKYRKVVERFDNRMVRCGLYFPLAKVWYEYP